MADDEEEEASVIYFPYVFVASIRQARPVLGWTNNDIEVTVAEYLEGSQACDCVSIDEPLSGDDVEDIVFRAIGSSPNIDKLLINQTERMGGNEIEQALEMAIQTLPHLTLVAFKGFDVTAAEAERIMSVLRTIEDPTKRLSVCFNVGSSFEETARPIAQFVQEASTLKDLSLHSGDPIVISQATMRVLCEAIGQSNTLEVLQFNREPTIATSIPTSTTALTRSAEMLADVAVASPSLYSVTFSDPCPVDFANRFGSALSHTQALKDFDLDFFKKDDGRPFVLHHRKQSPWKKLLSDDSIPLNYWPSILSRANGWTASTPTSSHKSLDIVMFLVREKSDVLLQNVKKRRIRKRKRFQFT